MLKQHCESSLVHAMSAARRQMAADVWTKPIDLNQVCTCMPVQNYLRFDYFDCCYVWWWCCGILL